MSLTQTFLFSMAARAIERRGRGTHHGSRRRNSIIIIRRSRNARSLVHLCYRRREEEEEQGEEPASRPRRADRRRPWRLGRQPRRVVHALARPGGCQIARTRRRRGRSGSGARSNEWESGREGGGGGRSEVEEDEGLVCECGRRRVGQSLGRRPVEYRGESKNHNWRTPCQPAAAAKSVSVRAHIREERTKMEYY